MPPKNNITSISITTSTLIRFFLVAIGLFLIWYLRELVLVVLSAIILASFVESAVPHFKKIGINRIFGVVIVYLSTVIILALLFYLFVPLLITEVYNFSVFLSSYIPNNAIINYFTNDAFGGAKDIINNLSHSLSLTTLLETSKAFISNLSGGFFQVIVVAFGGILNVILIVLISFYLSIQEKGIEKFLRIILPIKYEEYAVDLWERSRKKIALWMKGQLLLGVLITILTYLMLSLMGIQYALLLSIIAGIMELVPYGILVALIPAVYFSFLSGGLSTALMVTGAYIILHQFEVFLFSPLVIKNVVGLSPLVVIIAAVVGFELSGFWGLVLAIPVAVFLMELLSDLEKKKTSSRISNEN
ncbi:MAG: AI-2E family transporter [Candidatus Nomurabacteria bacterium]|nr:AI-2E family transporter [Candidatus Nomurabacteria bacterium]